ncbi:MAG: 2-dehydro-3-deoxygalactonokinase [Eubacteriales bacterium]
MFGVIDCGTTNTRVYLMDKNKVISQSSKKVGVRDTAINGTNEILKLGLIETIKQAVEKINKNITDIEYLIAFGMITSEIGLIEIPHLTAPINKNQLSQSIKIVHNENILPIDIPVYFIRGIKNKVDYENGLEDLQITDFMRGEEVQVIGIIEKYKPELPTNIMIVGSHTKLIHIDKDYNIIGCITTISGQFYEAIKKETFIGKCIKHNGVDENDTYSYEEIVDIAQKSVNETGILRTMLMPRFMQVLMSTTANERTTFVNASIATEDMKIFNKAIDYKFELNTDFFIMGQKARCDLYEILLKKDIHPNIRVTKIWEEEDIQNVTIIGALEVMKNAKVI